MPRKTTCHNTIVCYDVCSRANPDRLARIQCPLRDKGNAMLKGFRAIDMSIVKHLEGKGYSPALSGGMCKALKGGDIAHISARHMLVGATWFNVEITDQHGRYQGSVCIAYKM